MNDNEQSNVQREDFQHALEKLGTYVDVTLDDLLRIQQIASDHAKFRQTEKIFVRDIMTNSVITVRPSTSLKAAASLLLENGISGLPVVNDENKLVGIVTEADFLTAIGIPCHHPTHNLWHTLENMFTHKPQVSAHGAVVKDIMATAVIVIQADETLHDVIGVMKQHHIKRIVVVDADNHVEGIITRSNLVSLLLRKIL